MMREPALTCNGKVFAFYYADMKAMCFKLGKGFLIEEYGVEDVKFLSPFKNRPPMYAWYIVDNIYIEAWEELTQVALDIMRG